jgi:large subunit ribosomal protein L24e
MVVKRQCSFCAGEIEPGTGMMFVKRDGTVFHFCSSSCRKQQLHLGRVGHRLKWTRAHALKRAQSVAPSPVIRPPAPPAEREPVLEKPKPSEAAPPPAAPKGRARRRPAVPASARGSSPAPPIEPEGTEAPTPKEETSVLAKSGAPAKPATARKPRSKKSQSEKASADEKD